MLNNYYTVRAVAASLATLLKDAVVQEVFSQERDELVLKFRGREDALVISCRTDRNTLFLNPRYARSRSNSADLLPQIVGTAIGAIAIHPADRVVTFTLDGGQRLIAEFFGPRSNIHLVDGTDQVAASFKNNRQLAGTLYAPAAREPIRDPSEAGSIVASQPDNMLGSALKAAFPQLGGVLVREAMYRCGIPFSAACADPGSGKILELQEALRSLVSELDSPAPRVYLSPGGRPAEFSIVALRHKEEMEEKRFDDLHEAIRYFTSRRSSVDARDEQRNALRMTIRRHVEKAQRASLAIAADAREHMRGDEYERCGSVLMENLSALKKGMTRASLAGADADIALDATRTPVENAQRYFEKAKRARRAQKEDLARRDELDARAARGEALLRSLATVETKEGMQEFLKSHAAALEEFGIGKKVEERERLPFRVFTVDGGFEVWVGKSSANNDLLTFRHAKPGDLWFHARGASGSHVVLKMNTGIGQPGKKAREQAAAIAAYYSKMKKAKAVPVAMTERKYVRKPKGAPPGTVTLERENVIFAEPALPQPGNIHRAGEGA